MAGDDGDGIANALLRSVIKTLDLCAPCKNRLLEKDGDADLASDSESDAGIPQAKSDSASSADNSSHHNFEIEYTQSTTKRARFTKSTLQTVVVDSCTWINVSFTNCKLTDVTFKNATFRNAHFVNIDFTKVTFRDIELEDVQWTDEFLEYAVLTQDSYNIRHDRPSELQFHILTQRTRGGRKNNASFKDFAKGEISDQRQLRTIAMRHVSPKGLMSMPDSVLARIAGYLLPFGPLYIQDRAVNGGDGDSSSQTTYSSVWEPERLTYVARGLCTPATINGPEDAKRYLKLGFTIALLRVNRRLYDIASPLLYDRAFCFHRSLLACLAFLHDHQKPEQAIYRIWLPFNGRYADVFQKIIDVLVHKRTDVVSVELTIGGIFWDEAPWRRSARKKKNGEMDWTKCALDALNWGSTSSSNVLPGDSSQNFLKHFSRLPLHQGGHRLITSVRISGSEETPDRKAFLTALTAEVARLRSLRTHNLAIRPHSHCSATKLEECCYWQRPEDSIQVKPRGLFKLPEEVVEKIVQYLFPTGRTGIIKSPVFHLIKAGHTQTTYPRQRYSTLRTTYTGWLLSHRLQDTTKTLNRPKSLGVCVAFLRANRRCYELGVNRLYLRRLQFDSNPATCLAFLHDHRREEHRIRRITLRYDEQSSCNAWRRLFNVLVHSRPDVIWLIVKVSRKFWDVAPYRQSVQAVMSWKGWCQTYGEPCCSERNFLQHVARLSDQSPRRRVDIEIEGQGATIERSDFVNRLQDEVRRRMRERPELGEVSHGRCAPITAVKTLEGCCYWGEDTICRRLKTTRLLPPEGST